MANSMYIPKLARMTINVIFVINVSKKLIEKQILSLNEETTPRNDPW